MSVEDEIPHEDMSLDELKKRQEELERKLDTFHEMIEMLPDDRYRDGTSGVSSEENYYRSEWDKIEEEKYKIENKLDSIMDEIEEREMKRGGTEEQIPEMGFEDKKYLKNEPSSAEGKDILKNLMKEYRNREEKIIEIEKKMEEDIQKMDDKEPKEKRDELKEHYMGKIEKHEKRLNKIEKELIEHHPGEKEIVKNEYGTIHFNKSKSLKVNDYKEAIRIIEENGSLSEGVYIKKNYLKELKKDGLVDDSVASYKNDIELKANLDDEEKNLYEKLRSIRNSIAEQKNTKKYYIFKNNALKEMARLRPKTEKQMKKLKGVGDANFDKYGETFLEAIEKFNNKEHAN